MLLSWHITKYQSNKFLKNCELVKAKVAANWQIKEQLCDSFVHIIKELQGSDLISQAFIDLKQTTSFELT